MCEYQELVEQAAERALLTDSPPVTAPLIIGVQGVGASSGKSKTQKLRLGEKRIKRKRPLKITNLTIGDNTVRGVDNGRYDQTNNVRS
jgi:hypothetical protein